MTQAPLSQGSPPSKRGQKFLIAALGSAMVALAGTSAFFIHGAASGPFLSLTGAKPDAVREIYLQTSGSVMPLALEQHHDTLRYSNDPALSQARYIIHLSLQDGLRGRQDIRLHIDRNRRHVLYNLSGFAPEAQIDLHAAQQPLEKGLSLDWAGRIEFDADLPAKADEICLSVENMPASPLTLCHRVADRRDA